MYERANPQHPDKIADRISGAMVDLAYSREDCPRVAVECLIGHGYAYVIAESSVVFHHDDVMPIVKRIAPQIHTLRLLSTPQDKHLADNQHGTVKAGDNGIFRGMPITPEQQLLTNLAGEIYKRWPYDGKYLIGPADNITLRTSDGRIDLAYAKDEAKKTGIVICQSNAEYEQVVRFVDTFWENHNIRHAASVAVTPEYGVIAPLINPLGSWTGGPDVDCGAVNRKLGSDMGDAVSGGGLHGKDLSKADVSANIVCHLIAQREQKPVECCCSIGDESLTFRYGTQSETHTYPEVVAKARAYIQTLGGFERFAEWGLLRPSE